MNDQPRAVEDAIGPQPNRAGRRKTVVRLLTASAGDSLGRQSQFDAIQALLPGVRVSALAPSLPRRRGLAAQPASTFRSGRTQLLLAGGSAIGSSTWVRPLLAASKMNKARPVIVLGAGVEEWGSDFDSEAQQRWQTFLQRAGLVAVRGPDSVRRLAEIGVVSHVSGDPALVLMPDQNPQLERARIGLALGQIANDRGHAGVAVGHLIARAATILCSEGVELRIIVGSEHDRREALACAAHIRLSGGQVELVDAVDPQSFLNAASGCSVLLAQRVAGLVLGAAAGVPVVAAGAGSGVTDFMKSIERHQHVYDDPELEAEDLVQELQAALVRARFESREQGHAVDHLRSVLRREARWVATRCSQ